MPPCRQLDDLTRLDERPRKQPRLGVTRQHTEPATPTISNTTIKATIALPRAMGQQPHQPVPVADHAPQEQPERQPVGTPRKVVQLNDAVPEIIPTGPQRTGVVEPARVTTPAAALPAPRSKTTRSGAAAHGVPPTPALPMEACMLMLQGQTPTTEAAHYRQVLLTTTNPHRRRVTLTTAQDDDQHDQHGTEDAPRRC